MRTSTLFFFLLLLPLSACQRGVEKSEPKGRFVPMKDLVQDAPPGSDSVLRASTLLAGPSSVLSGASTTATDSEVLDRIEAALEGRVSRTGDIADLNFRLSISQARASLMASRDPADFSTGAIFALGQLVYGACGSLGEAELLSAYGINIRMTIDQNAAQLKAFGLRLFSNSTLITAVTAPALYAQAGVVFDGAIAKLKTASYAGRFPTEAAAQAICVSAIHAGAFRSGS